MALVEQGGGGLPPPNPPNSNKGFFREGTDVIHTQSAKASRVESEASAGPDAYWIYRTWMLEQMRLNPMLNPNWRPTEISTDSMLVEGRGAAPSMKRSWEGQRLGPHRQYPFGDSNAEALYYWNPTFSERDIQIYRDTVEQAPTYYSDFITFYVNRFTHYR